MKRKLSILLSILIVLFISNPSFKKLSAAEGLATNAKSAYLMEIDTNRVLFQKNENERLALASMTKIMTLTLICDAIRDGKIEMKTIITGNEEACSMGGSQIYLKVGEQFTLEEMLKCICVASANDCAVAVACHLYGTEKMFVKKMNEKVQSLGLENTHFEDCTGLTNENHYSSAYDMAQISSYLIRNYGDIILPFTSLYDAYIRENTESPFWLVNTNKLIGKVDGVDGLKTGWTGKAGYCLTATAKRGNMRLISSVFGYDSPQTRNTETVALLNYGFSNYDKRIILPYGTVIYDVWDKAFVPEHFSIIALKDVSLVEEKGSPKKDVSWNITKYPNYKTGEMGQIEVYYDTKLIEKIDINVKEEIRPKSFFELFFHIFCEIFI